LLGKLADTHGGLAHSKPKPINKTVKMQLKTCYVGLEIGGSREAG
jgi:hypothetical protein